jgi:hypothetical protein
MKTQSEHVKNWKEEVIMKQKFEYKFVRVGEGWLGVSRKAEDEYRQIIQDHARDGWRLVQVFAPSTGTYGIAKYFEVILERELGT